MNTLQLYHPRRRSIGLTALIDVVFILLLLFMLSSTFNRWRAIDFESSLTVTNETVDEPQIVLLGETGSLKLNNSDFSVANLDQLTVNDARIFEMGKPLLLLAAANTNVQMIVNAIERLNMIGLQQVAFVGTLPGETD